jgi:hypothetical protein
MLQVSNFTKPLNKKGGLKPPDSILNLISNLNSTNDNLGEDIINKIKYFENYFLHNRIGDYLTKGEKEYLSMSNRPTFKRGGLMVHEERYREYKWVMFLEDDPTHNFKKMIKTKDINGNIITRSVFSRTLFNYIESEIIDQDPQEKTKLETSFLIETYKFDA